MRQLDVVPNSPEAAKTNPNEGNRIYLAKNWLNATVQGEGVWTGIPSFFVRTYGCSLSCENCDTRYTWMPGSETSAVDLSVKHAAQRISQMKEAYSAIHHVVVTGGEPSLQAEAVIKMLDYCATEMFVTMETNGLHFNSDLLDRLSLLSLSPKLSWLSSQGVKATKALFVLPESLHNWLTQAQVRSIPAQVKFVVESEGDIEFAVWLLKELVNLGYLSSMEHAIVQPEWGAHGTNLKPFLEKILDSGVRILPQHHKVWGVY